MNKICDAWNKHENRKTYDGPDSISIEGQKFQFEEINMAVRKKPVTEPVFDNDAVNKDKNVEKSLIVHELSKHDFNSLILYLLKSPIHKAQIIRAATWATLKRLRVKRNKSKARVKIPKGVSNQGDAGSIVMWLSKIKPEHKTSIKQLIIIDATAVGRDQ